MNLRHTPSAMTWFLALIGLGLAIGEAIGGASADDVLILLLGVIWVLMYGSMAAQRDDAVEQLRHRTEQYRALMEGR
jgi:predicted MFS family arabinose efflux permease